MRTQAECDALVAKLRAERLKMQNESSADKLDFAQIDATIDVISNRHTEDEADSLYGSTVASAIAITAAEWVAYNTSIDILLAELSDILDYQIAVTSEATATDEEDDSDIDVSGHEFDEFRMMTSRDDFSDIDDF